MIKMCYKGVKIISFVHGGSDKQQKQEERLKLNVRKKKYLFPKVRGRTKPCTGLP